MSSTIETITINTDLAPLVDEVRRLSWSSGSAFQVIEYSDARRGIMDVLIVESDSESVVLGIPCASDAVQGRVLRRLRDATFLIDP